MWRYFQLADLGGGILWRPPAQLVEFVIGLIVEHLWQYLWCWWHQAQNSLCIYYPASQKTGHPILAHNFTRCWSIINILSAVCYTITADSDSDRIFKISLCWSLYRALPTNHAVGECFLWLFSVTTYRWALQCDEVSDIAVDIFSRLLVYMVTVISNKLEGDLLILLVRCCGHLIARGKSALLSCSVIFLFFYVSALRHTTVF